MELPIKKSIKIKDGSHDGVIVNVQYREEPHKYTDVEVEFMPVEGEGQTIKLKVGYPTCVSNESRLGHLMDRFGVPLVEGETVDPSKVLINKPCTFITMTQKNDKGEFSRIIPESLKPRE